MLTKTVVKFLLLMCVLFSAPVWSQEENADAVREKSIAERFMQVLLRRPAPGTALDRVYGYHVQAGSLDDVFNELKTDIEKGGEEAGSKAMLLGLMQLQRGSDADAAESLAVAERLRPDDAMASYHLGKSLLLIGRGEAAAEALERAIERRPARNEALPVFTELGRLYGRSQQNEKAFAVWTRLEATFPGDTRVSEQIAQTLAEDGQDEAALQRYETLSEKTASANDSQSIGYQIAAAELKRKIGRGDEALVDLETILARLRPSSWLHSDVQRRIEAGFLRSGDYGGLAKYYAKQVQKQPDALELRMRLGQVQSKAGLLIDAEKTLRDSVELAPTQTDPRLALVDLLQATAQYSEAAEQLRQLVKQDTENPDYLIRLGNTLLEDSEKPKEQRYSEAAAAWQQLADARKEDAVIIAQVGDLMRRIERTDDAMKLYQRAIELAPDQPQYREYLGEYYSRLGRKDDALRVWNLMTEGERATRDNFIRLAEVLNTFDQSEKALAAFGRAAEMDPTLTQRLRFTELLSRASRYDDALEQLDAAQPAAESPEEREQLLRARIGVYASSGKLDERIAEAQEKSEQTRTSEAFRRLALLLDAAAKNDEAVVAIESAMQADPSDIGAMEVAAELYRKTSRSADAILVYRRLAETDVRFLPNYLKRISSLHMELGQVDESLAAAEELIAAGPGNPESYRFYATQCFRVGRDDEGIERLRRALRAAPRDRDARRALASALDDRFRTEEAIELYWALLEDTNDLAEQRGLVKSLAALYGRKGDFDRLLSRLKLRGREASDMRTATLLTSEAHRSMDDLGAAATALEPLLAENPRDAELIGQLVELSEAADDLETALQYQEQLTKLADTPENRNRELRLLISMGQMDRVEATLQRMQGFTDPLDLVEMIDRAMAKQEMTAAQRFCELALEKDAGLWEVRARLASLLIVNDELDRAEAEIETIASLDLPDGTQSEKRKDELAKAKARASSQNRTPSVQRPDIDGAVWLSRTQNISQLAYFFKLGRYANVSFGFSSSARGAVEPDDVAHAKMYAEALRMVLAEKRGTLDEFIEAAHLEDDEQLASIDDVEELKRILLLSFLRPSFSTDNQPSPMNENLMWRLIEKTSAQERVMIGYQLLQNRAQIHVQNERGRAKIEIEPLSEDQIDLLQTAIAKANTSESDSSSRDVYLTRFLHTEFKEAGLDERAAALRDSVKIEVDSFATASKAITFAAGFDDSQRVTELLDLVYENLADWSTKATPDDLTKMLAATRSIASLKEIDDERLLKAADMIGGLYVLTMQNQKSPRRSTRGVSSNAGVVNTYYNAGGSYEQLNFQVPLSGDPTVSALIQAFAQLGLLNADSSVREKLPQHWADSPAVLTERPELAKQEMQLRQTLAAYSHWWVDEPEKTYDAVVALSEADPEDNDWWIERARLAAELKMPETSLDALDSINPMDQSTLQLRELAAMNLASQLGDLERAKTAAQRLFGMRLDKNTELALADQLTRLGMQEMSAAILQRSRRRGGQSIGELLSLADRYVAAGDQAAAAEVAYSAMRKLGRGGERNEDYYRRRAVEMLRKAGRLDSIIAQAESRVASSPDSLSLKSALYTAAGRKDDADKMFNAIATLQPNDPKTMWAAAERLTSAGKHDEAIEKFVAAVVKEPTLLNNDYYRLINCLRQCESREKAFEGLMKLKFQGLRSHIISQLASSTQRSRGNDDEPAGEFEEAFLAKVLKEGPVDSLDDVLRSILRSPERMKSDAVADTVRRILMNGDFYLPTSQMWQRGSYSSNGQFYGVIDPCLKIIAANTVLKKDVQELLQKKADAKEGSPIAELMLIALNASEGVSDAVGKELEELFKKDTSEIPYHLWWQFGQVIEGEKSWIQKGLVVDVYEKAHDVAGDGNGRREYQYSVGPRLADAYVAAGRKADAKRELLSAYANTDNSDQNQSNPGYGDYQDLETFTQIAGKLVQSGSRLAAIPIYADALSKPERFERAKQWGGRSSSEENFKKALDETLATLTDEDFTEYLTLAEPGSEIIKSEAAAIDLMSMTPTVETDPMESSVAAIVVSRLNETKEGREKLITFLERANERWTLHPHDTSLAGVTAIVSSVLEQDSAPENFNRLSQLIPIADPKKKGQVTSDHILDLYSPILVGIVSKDESTRIAAAAAADKLATLAGAVERPAIREILLLTKIQHALEGDASGEAKLSMLGAMLDQAAPASSPPKVLNVDAAENCIRIAEIAVKAQAWPVALDAIARALGGGPPLRTVGGSVNSGSTFLLQTSRNTSNQEPTDDKLGLLIQRTLDALEAFGPAIENDSQLAEIAYAALADVVMPPARESEIFPHTLELLGTNGNNPFGNENAVPILDPASVSGYLVAYAKQSGQTSELESRLTQRREQVSAKPLADFIALQIAMQQDDAEVLGRAIDRFSASTGVVENANDATSATQPVNVDAKSSLEDQTNANVLLHALLSMHARDGMTPAAARIAKRLLTLAARDSGVSQSFQYWEWIVKQFIADKETDDDTVDSFVGLYSEANQQHFAPYAQDNADYVAQRIAHFTARLVEPATQAQRFELAARCQRPMYIETRRQGRRLDKQFASLPVVLADPKSQYEYFSAVLFGDEDETTANADAEEAAVKEYQQTVRDFLLLDRWCWFAEPPTVLESAAPNLAAVQAMHLAASDFPVDTIGQSIAISAAACEKTDELIARLEPLVVEPGDSVDSVIGLAHLAAGRTEQAGAVIDRVATFLKKTLPKEKVKTPMMHDSAALFVRAFEVDELRERVVAAWPSMQTHFRKRDIQSIAGHYNNVGTRIVPSFAYGARVDHGLDHFVAYQLPTGSTPVSDASSPTWISRDGTLRYGGGMSNNLMLLKYPLAGDFKFKFREVKRPSGSFGSIADGQTFHARIWDGTTRVEGVIARGNKEWELKSDVQAKDRVNELRFEGDELTLLVNGEPSGKTIRSSAFPFVGLYMRSYGDCEAADLAIQGDVTIPREVNLIDEELRGWSCPIHSGNLPEMTLRTDQENEAKTEDEETPSAKLAWFEENGTLRSGDQEMRNTPGNCRHIQYQRPLLDGETVQYQYEYEAEKTEVHPSIGRVAVMIRPGGVKLRWLVQSKSMETTKEAYETEVDPAEILIEGGVDGGIELTPTTQVSLTAEGERCLVRVNGTPVCRFTMALDRRPGFLCEKDRDVRITNLILTGDWPETLPENLLER